MACIRIFTLLLIAITYYVLCSCKFLARNNFQLKDHSSLFRQSSAALHRQQHAAFTKGNIQQTLREKRSQKYDNFIEQPSAVMDLAPRLSSFDRIPFNDYNRIVSALKEMLRVNEEKSVMLRPRPGRRALDGDSPILQYFIDDTGNLGIGSSDIVAVVGEDDDGLTDTSLKKSAPFKPRLGKRRGNQICV
ncbi:unnamed protein product [Ceratitis capitata]|uniref:(Mediterranean fruit fly) hypothetical protein n=1 Tax=Ceratitis capitata TaxID=7213 RepID=A0A811UAY1_CERCA|nr:unnamed protein product [Ceratitis capitata]